jgi:hypothetical protein
MGTRIGIETLCFKSKEGGQSFSGTEIILQMHVAIRPNPHTHTHTQYIYIYIYIYIFLKSPRAMHGMLTFLSMLQTSNLVA